MINKNLGIKVFDKRSKISSSSIYKLIYCFCFVTITLTVTVTVSVPVILFLLSFFICQSHFHISPEQGGDVVVVEAQRLAVQVHALGCAATGW